MTTPRERSSSALAASGSGWSWARVTLLLLSLTGCGRKGSPGESSQGGDGGPSDGGPASQVQIIRQPGRLEGSPSFAIVIPRLDAGVQIPPFDAGPGPVSE